MGPGSPAGPAEHGQVADIGLESVTLVQGGHQGRYRLGRDLGDPPALSADQVHVLGLFGQVIPGRSVPEVGVGHQAELLEQFERAVHGGNVHAAGGLLDVGPDFLGRGVLQPGDRREDQLALGRDAVATGP